MKAILILCLLAVAATAEFTFQDSDLVVDNAAFHAHLENQTLPFEITKDNAFSGMTWAQLKRFAGARLPAKNAAKKVAGVKGLKGLPDSFDWRSQSATCIHAVRDQAQCGSCWAFSSVGALADRFCISSKGATNVILSPQWLVSCDKTDEGCNGGYLDNAWNYLHSTGTVTESCFPYASQSGTAPSCIKKCADSSKMTMYKADTPRSWSDAKSMMQEIYTNGPIQASFEVYADFYKYSSGVYKHTSGALAGGHAIEIVGWGSSPSAHWIVKNSWNTNWGIKGYFLIARGTDECNIEDDAHAALPLVTARATYFNN